MTHFSKSIVLLIVVTCALLAVPAWAWLRGAVSQRGVESYEGYFAPVYSPDGQYVYYVERRTSGTAKETRTEDFFGGSSKSLTRERGLICLEKMVPPARFQRATFRLGGGRSMQLSYGSTSE